MVAAQPCPAMGLIFPAVFSSCRNAFQIQRDVVESGILKHGDDDIAFHHNRNETVFIGSDPGGFSFRHDLNEPVPRKEFLYHCLCLLQSFRLNPFHRKALLSHRFRSGVRRGKPLPIPAVPGLRLFRKRRVRRSFRLRRSLRSSRGNRAGLRSSPSASPDWCRPSS